MDQFIGAGFTVLPELTENCDFEHSGERSGIRNNIKKCSGEKSGLRLIIPFHESHCAFLFSSPAFVQRLVPPGRSQRT